MKRLRFLIYLALVSTVIGSVSCNKIKNKKQQLSQSIHRFIFDRKDRIFPGFDSATPDTESNRRRFKDFLGIEPTSDVKNIYCNSDRLGIDASFSFAFDCDSSTHQTIIRQLHLNPDSVIIYGFDTGSFGTNVWWWNKEITLREKPYSRQYKDLRWHLWRDQKNGKDYFVTYDM